MSADSSAQAARAAIEALEILRQHAEDMLDHRNAGQCPERYQPDARDPRCRVCQALAEFDGQANDAGG